MERPWEALDWNGKSKHGLPLHPHSREQTPLINSDSYTTVGQNEIMPSETAGLETGSSPRNRSQGFLGGFDKVGKVLKIELKIHSRNATQERHIVRANGVSPVHFRIVFRINSKLLCKLIQLEIIKLHKIDKLFSLAVEYGHKMDNKLADQSSFLRNKTHYR